MLFGVDNQHKAVLKCLGLDVDNVPRFRDAYYDDSGDRLVIYTRTGGGNRSYFESRETRIANYEIDDSDEEYLKVPYNEDLRGVPGYIYDEDDDYDNTYAIFFYEVPEEFKETFRKAYELCHEPSSSEDQLTDEVN